MDILLQPCQGKLPPTISRAKPFLVLYRCWTRSSRWQWHGLWGDQGGDDRVDGGWDDAESLSATHCIENLY